MVLEMNRLDWKSKEFKNYEQHFYKSWQHPTKTCKVKQVYVATTQEIARSYRGKCFNAYRKRHPYTLLYHGTQRACKVGEAGDSLWLCKEKDCYTCQVLWRSFKINKSQGGMFGQGIYSTPVSSKADIYAKNHHIHSHMHAVILCQVVCDQPQRMTAANHTMTSPGTGFNCVRGLTTAEGGTLNYPEIVVYQNEAIIPIGLILYTREGW